VQELKGVPDMNAGPIYVSILRRYLLYCLATGSLSAAIVERD
jgi:hypothetical protein